MTELIFLGSWDGQWYLISLLAWNIKDYIEFKYCLILSLLFYGSSFILYLALSLLFYGSSTLLTPMEVRIIEVLFLLYCCLS